MSNQKKTDLQCILTSLFYLSDEATRRSLPQVANIIKTSIDEVGAWMDADQNVLTMVKSASLLDESLYHALSFLNNLTKLSEGNRTDFIKVFEAISMQVHDRFQLVVKPDEEAFKNNLKAPRPSRSRKKAAVY